MNSNSRHDSSNLIHRLLVDDGGQDLVEYAFLAAFIGIAGYAVILTVPALMGDTYDSWLDNNNGVPAQWEYTPAPASASS